MSATRVMATCALVGQAAGTAAAIATREHALPRDVYEHQVAELQAILMGDDCYLPWQARPIPPLTQMAKLTASEGDPEPLRNGLDRPINGVDNGWTGSPGAWVQLEFEEAHRVTRLRFVFDSDLNRSGHNSVAAYPLDMEPVGPPETLVRAFRVEALNETGIWTSIVREDNNYQRLVRLDIDVTTRALRLVPETTWGAAEAHVFAWDAS